MKRTCFKMCEAQQFFSQIMSQKRKPQFCFTPTNNVKSCGFDELIFYRISRRQFFSRPRPFLAINKNNFFILFKQKRLVPTL